MTMTISEMWKYLVQPHLDITESYSRILSDYRPLKCVFMALAFSSEPTMFCHNAKEVQTCDNGMVYEIESADMLMTGDNEFIVYIKLK